MCGRRLLGSRLSELSYWETEKIAGLSCRAIYYTTSSILGSSKSGVACVVVKQGRGIKRVMLNRDEASSRLLQRL